MKVRNHVISSILLKLSLIVCLLAAQGSWSPNVASADAVWPRAVVPPLPTSTTDVADPVISLSGAWKFHLNPPSNFWGNNVDPSAWEDLQVPHDLFAEGIFQNLGNKLDRNGNPFMNRELAYKKEVTIPADYSGKTIMLRFEGAYNFARVWVDGQLIRTHRGAFTTWDADITDYVTPGQSVWITVGLTYESMRLDYQLLGGIHREVQLVALSRDYVTRLHYETDLDETYTDAILKVAAGVEFNGDEEGILHLTLKDPDGAEMAITPNSIMLSPANPESTVDIPIVNPVKWDSEHPHLYTLDASLEIGGSIVQTISKKVGFREISWSGKNMYVNGQEIKLRGVNWHQVIADRGIVPDPVIDEQMIRQLKAANINFIRTAHFPQTEQVLDLCDELGIYVEEEASVIFVDTADGPQNVVNNPSYTAAFMDPLSEMIERDRSHASIIIWSLGNESFWGSNFQKGHDYLRMVDPSRPTIFSYPFTRPDAKYEIWSKHYQAHNSKEYGTHSMPELYDEYAHDYGHNKEGLKFDPGFRDFYGVNLKKFWEPMYSTNGVLGGAIWGGVDLAMQRPNQTNWGIAQWGMLDAWGREKPEYYHMKKVYSPIILMDGPVINPGSGHPLEISVENRYNHTNFNELEFAWAVGQESGVLTNVNIPQRSSGVITLPARDWEYGEIVALNVFKDSELVDEFELPIGRPDIEFPLPQGTPSIVDNSSTIEVSGSDFNIVFSKSTGLITNGSYKGTSIITGGPFLNLGNPTNVNQVLPNPNSWKLESVESKMENQQALISVKGSYDNYIGAQFLIRIDGTGLIGTTYAVRGLPESYTEVGIAYDLTEEVNELSWKRQGDYSVYPLDHIGRPEGVAQKIRPGADDEFRVRPSWSWSQDMKDFYLFGPSDSGGRGTNDFRSAKTNIHYASAMIEGTSNHLRAEGDGTGSVRAAVQDNGSIRFNVNNKWSRVMGVWNEFDNYSLPVNVWDGYFNTVNVRLTDNDILSTLYVSPSSESLKPIKATNHAGEDAPNLIDGNLNTSIISSSNPTFPQYLSIHYAEPQTFNAVTLGAWFAQGQAPTNWDIEVSQDGTTGWLKVGSSGNVAWQSNNNTVESRTIRFPEISGYKGVRVKINNANLNWNHYAVNGIQVSSLWSMNLPSNKALYATASASNGKDISSIKDGNDNSAYVSKDNPTFPTYLNLKWDDPQSFNSVILKTYFGQGQGPTSWDIEVSDDGENNWTKVAESGNVTWVNNSNTVEEKLVTFPIVSNKKGMRIKVKSANLTWSHFAVNEVEVYEDIGGTAIASTAGGTNISRINNGNDTDGYVSVDNPNLPQYITFNWNSPQSFTSVRLFGRFAGNQSPTNWDIEVSEDGSSNWQKVASSGDVNWKMNNSTLESKLILFPRVSNKKGMRIKVNSAKLVWNHYAIYQVIIAD